MSLTAHQIEVLPDDERSHRADLVDAAESKWVHELTVRVKRLERTIRTFLSSKTLSRAQRTELIGLLAGTRLGKVDQPLSGLNLTEERLVRNFRAMTPYQRRLVTGIVAELALHKER